MDKKTKIVCTIGPASFDSAVLRRMFEAGMNCVRLNGAFADIDEINKTNHLVREISNEISLMIDVKGPEVRLNKFEKPILVQPGDVIIIGNTESDEVYPANYLNIQEKIEIGQRILIGDGDVELNLKEKKDGKMFLEIVYGTKINPGKAMNFPGTSFANEVLTEKDMQNLNHAKSLNWDFVSASFMRNAESAKYVKEQIKDSQMKLIAKIEDDEGVKNIDEILDIADGVMIARGGLGVELGLEKVPHIQRLLIDKCNKAAKPVITATQMLESMTYNPRPTRAEANDVATAIFQGTDSVMLSGESSAGTYPGETVEFMTKIIKETEGYLEPKIIDSRTHGPLSTDALTKSAAQMCIDMQSEINKVIVVARTGRSARLIAKHSIKQPIFAFVSAENFMRELTISKGINKAFVIDKPETDRDNAIRVIIEKAKELGVIQDGENILLVSKTPYGDEEFFPNVFEMIKV